MPRQSVHIDGCELAYDERTCVLHILIGDRASVCSDVLIGYSSLDICYLMYIIGRSAALIR